MKKEIKPSYPGEGVDYQKTSKGSIWREGDKETWEKLEKAQISGKWINLAAGDGRYNNFLLSRADEVVVSDIDAKVLDKLCNEAPSDLKNKLSKKVFDIKKTFPFPDETVDGVFCTGTLHLLPKENLIHALSEIKRILKKDGTVFIDFATDVKRVAKDGSLIIFGDEPQYKLNDAKELLEKLFKDYEVGLIEARVEDDFVESNPPYAFECNYLILNAKAKQE